MLILKKVVISGKHADNYRPVALCTVISELNELCLLMKIENVLSTTDNQFVVKKHTTTKQASYSLKKIIYLRLKRGSPVFICFLDSPRVYDRVNFWKLF